ncbi:2-isopropylmalate synthase [uncultured Marinobacter sp.]|uniref:2-isopropylmalate synthase n=1 Tax=uncultured Marinobacter sp. TaxID=187379 RepID=UPI0026044238|nr:2-isopropylmalate synthase [uncultured Marinobacter sp.]
MIQTEAQRQFYLGLAGIRLWYAREPLPGAASSRAFVFPEPDEVVHSPSVAPGPAPVEAAKNRSPAASDAANKKGVQRIASLQALMESKEEPSAQQSAQPKQPPEQGLPEISVPSPEGSEVTVASPHDAEEPAVALSLGVFFGSKYVLIADISREASLNLQETLAANILKSLGDGHLKPVGWVHWPVFNNRVVPGNSLSDLRAVVRHVLRDIEDRKVIVLGADEGADRSGAEAGWLFKALGRAPDVKAMHTLAALASNPSLKRSLWEQLKPLAEK